MPAVAYESAFRRYRPTADAGAIPWRESNDTAARIGGWRAYAREAQRPEPAASVPAARPAPQPAARPAAQPASQPAARPAAQPASQPASQPAVRPAEPDRKTMTMPMPMPMPQGHGGHKTP